MAMESEDPKKDSPEMDSDSEMKKGVLDEIISKMHHSMADKLPPKKDKEKEAILIAMKPKK